VKSRRLTFQLTPLLDLLLIVIFAQFLDVRDTTTEREQSTTTQLSAAQEELAGTQDQLAKILAEKNEMEADREFLRASLQELKDSTSGLELERKSLEESLKRAHEQRDTVANLVAALFDLPDETINELIRTRAPENVRLTPEQVKRLREEFKSFSKQNPGESVRHLLTFEEMRKRCDIWELYINDTGKTFFSGSGQSHTFRAETAEEFADELYERYKTLPQPKSLVIILLSYGDVKASVYEAAIDGLPIVAERMRTDQSGRSRFEYAVLGFNPTPPVVPEVR
jgi:myosin heavy subunit